MNYEFASYYNAFFHVANSSTGRKSLIKFRCLSSTFPMHMECIWDDLDDYTNSTPSIEHFFVDSTNRVYASSEATFYNRALGETDAIKEYFPSGNPIGILTQVVKSYVLVKGVIYKGRFASSANPISAEKTFMKFTCLTNLVPTLIYIEHSDGTTDHVFVTKDDKVVLAIPHAFDNETIEYEPSSQRYCGGRLIDVTQDNEAMMLKKL